MKRTVPEPETQGTGLPCPADKARKCRFGRTGILVAALLVGLCCEGRPAPAFEGTSRDRREAAAAGARSAGAQAAGVEAVSVDVPAPSARTLSYYRSGNVFWAIGTLWGLALPAIWLCTGASAALAALARRHGRNPYFTGAIYAAGYIALSTLATLPLSYYVGFVRPHAYGLSDQSLARWAGNLATSTAVGMLMGALLLWIPYTLLKRSPRRWWFYAWLLSLPLVVFVMLLRPIFYDPLFHHFGRMHDKNLERQILALAQRAGITADRVYEVDMSADTSTVNAYVTGLGQTHRIVLWDTLIERLEPKQVLFVMAHEIGHYALGHVVRTIVLLWFANFLGFYLVHRASGALLRRSAGRLGFDHLSELASVPLFILLFQALELVAMPVGLAYSRAQEHDADQFALELTRLNHSGALGFVRMMDENLSNPWPGWFYSTWRATHPSLGQRVEFCNQYHPWRAGAPLRYSALFRPESPPKMPPDGHHTE
jgi:STE24 endopeptidase